jgi:phospholipase C
VVTAFPLTNTSQGSHVSQSWKDSHDQINGGRMDGFVRAMNSVQPMGYYTPEVLPFAYSLASTFTVATRWFCSLPGPTYPNRRFLLAGTAYGTTMTHGDPLVAASPPGGTVFELLSKNGISWADYFSDVPMSMVIGRGILEHADHHHPIVTFYDDRRTGRLPQVSFVDPRIGVASRIGQPIAQLPWPFDDWLKGLGADLSGSDPAETEEDPQDMYYGEAWAYKVVTSIVQSPQWPQTCLIYLYDEHGGYYDHVAPPVAIPPDDIKPILQPGDPDVGYDMYGPRVPAIVVSPHSKPGGATNVVHDHTSVLATIEAKWNLAALTRRDANAQHIMDFHDAGAPSSGSTAEREARARRRGDREGRGEPARTRCGRSPACRRSGCAMAREVASRADPLWRDRAPVHQPRACQAGRVARRGRRACGPGDATAVTTYRVGVGLSMTYARLRHVLDISVGRR